MNILYQQPITVWQSWCVCIEVIFIVVLIVSIICLMADVKLETSLASFGLSLLASVIFLIVGETCAIPSGRYRYEVTFDKEYSIQDICENYEILGQRGLIWKLEDKK